MVYALDTNVIVHYLHNNHNVSANFHKAVMDNCEFIVPKMVDYEIRRGFVIKPNPRREAEYNALVSECDIVDIDAITWDYAMHVYAGHYRNRHTTGEMDILIASLCIQNGYTLVTNNASDFVNVDGLTIIDWTQL